MDTSAVVGVSSVSSMLMTLLIYIIYRICNHCHLISKCCGKETVIDFDTRNKEDDKPPEPINIK
jgi:hypothetical protein